MSGKLAKKVRLIKYEAEKKAKVKELKKSSSISAKLVLLTIFLFFLVLLFNGFFMTKLINKEYANYSLLLFLFTIIILIRNDLSHLSNSPLKNEIKTLEKNIQYYKKEIKQHKIKDEGLRKERERLNSLRSKAKVREMARDYNSAIEIWEELGEIREAARVRKIQAEIGSVKVSQKVVHGDEVTKTEIKDSVLNRSNVGGKSSKAEELREAKSLFEEGLIDEDEFKQMKKEILGK